MSTMNANEFVTKLKELAPAKSTLLECGYGDDEADEFVESFVCRPRIDPLSIDTRGDSMLELISGWDISHVEIGPISFHSRPQTFEGHLEIGTVEGDRLVYRTETKDYALLDSQNLQHVMCAAASDGDTLLNGLLEVAGYYAKTATEEIDIDDEAVGTEYKGRCVSAFGGNEMFCSSLLGV